jgi:Ice-binding-like/Bacterial Ig domain
MSGHKAGQDMCGVARRIGRMVPLLLAVLVVVVLPSTAQAAQPPVLLGTADSFALLGGTTITNTGDSVINGDLGLHPGTAVTGFPPGTVNGAQHVADALAQQAKSDLTTAYQDAAGRSFSATSPPDFGGRTINAGVYRTGSVASLGLTGNLTLDAQGDPRAVFIFQIESTLVTATDSSVSLINGAQACNVYWQVGSSATLGTRTAFKGNILALTSISVNDGVAAEGRLLARNGAVTLINDTVTRSQCAAGTGPGTTGPGTGPGSGSRPDVTGPRLRIIGVPGVPEPSVSGPGARRPPASTVCTTRNFTARVRVSDRAGIRLVNVFLDGRRVKRTTRTRFSIRVNVRDLRVGRHRITVVAYDRAGNRSVIRRHFGRCALALAVPHFTG